MKGKGGAYMTDPTLLEIHAQTFSADLGMYYCGRRLGTRNHVYGPEIRSHFLIVLVEKGSATLFRDEGNLSFGAQDMLVMFPGERIHYRAHSDWTIRWVGVDGRCIAPVLASLGITKSAPVFRPREHRAMSALIDELCDSGYDSSLATQCRFQALLYRLFAALLSDAAREPISDPIRAALDIIKYNYNNDLNVKALADSLFLDSAYFSRLFKKRVGLSPKQYILQMRLDKAKDLLASTNYSVKEIAATVGYSDPLYFSRLFCASESMTPSRWRGERSSASDLR